MKLVSIALLLLLSYSDVHAVTVEEDNGDKCQSIVDYLNSSLSMDGKLILNKIPGDVTKIRLGGLKTKEKFGLSSLQESTLQRVWLRYEDINNDQKRELFAEWISYANTYTDNRSSIYIFEYPEEKHLEDIFSKGKHKSEFYPDLESWMINSFQWEQHSGPLGAKNALPSSLKLTDVDIWHSGKGFSEPQNEYFLKVFSVKEMQYVLVSGRHEKRGKGYVIKLTDIETQKFETICKLSEL